MKDWSTELPFVDVFKTARPWIPNAVGSFEWDSEVAVPTDARGWPLKVPFDGGLNLPQEVKTLLMRELGYAYPAGTYTLIFEGDGTIEMGFDGRAEPFRGGGIYAFDVSEPSDEGILLRITRSNPQDPVRNIRVILPGYAATYLEQPFNPAFLNRFGSYAVLRFADWTEIQGQPLVRWSDRPIPADATQATSRGVAYEWMIRLANDLDADAWVNVPHMADDDFVRRMARLWARNLEPGRRLYLEHSNEVWNMAPDFVQSSWAQARGMELGLAPDDPFLACLRYQAKRSAEVFAIFADEFAADRDRVVNVLATWIAIPWVTEQLVDAFGREVLNGVPVNPAGINADALAVGAYFGGDELVASGELGLVSAPEILRRAGESLRGELAGYIRQQQALADRYQLPLIAYESGQHLVGTGANVWNENLAAALTAANSHPDMYGLYGELLDIWFEAGGGLFMAYSSSTRPSMWGAWGVVAYVDQPIEQAPKLRALIERIVVISDASEAATAAPACTRARLQLDPSG